LTNNVPRSIVGATFMEALIYIAFFVLFVLYGYLVHQHALLKRKLEEHNALQKKALAEAGNAITETLRVAFDNLKKNTNEHGKFNSKFVEHNSRIHRLEQHTSRTAKNVDQRKITADDGIAFSQEITKNNQR